MVSINQLELPKKEVISINQPNYKAPQKSHATEKLVGYIKPCSISELDALYMQELGHLNISRLNEVY